MGANIDEIQETKRIVANGYHIKIMKDLLLKVRKKSNIKADSLLVEIEKFINI